MALTLEAANRVRQKTLAFSRNAGVYRELFAFFLHMAANKGNPDLQIVNVDGTSMSSDGGAASQVIANVAGTLYIIYLKKTGTVATSFKANDNASTAAGDGTDTGPNQVITTAAEEVLFTYPTGHALANGLTIREDTTQTGTTRTLKANRLDGFIIVGA